MFSDLFFQAIDNQGRVQKQTINAGGISFDMMQRIIVRWSFFHASTTVKEDSNVPTRIKKIAIFTHANAVAVALIKYQNNALSLRVAAETEKPKTKTDEDKEKQTQ